MTMKITKTGRGSEANDESLLFEWLNHEVPESIKLSYETMLSTNKFAGSLQTNQIMGIYLEPITFSGEFFGEYISKNNNNQLEYITAKERSDQLARLQGRIIKFWFEGIKQLVIIQKYEIEILNYNHVQYTISLQPHDIQLPITPIEVKQYLTKSFIQTQEPINTPTTITGEPVEITYYNTKPTDNFKKESILTQKNFAINDILNKKTIRQYDIETKISDLKKEKASIKITQKGIIRRNEIQRSIDILEEENLKLLNNISEYDEQLKNLDKKPIKLDASAREFLQKVTQ